MLAPAPGRARRCGHDSNFCSGLGKAVGNAPPKSAGRADDDRDFIGQIEQLSRFHFRGALFMEAGNLTSESCTGTIQ